MSTNFGQSETEKDIQDPVSDNPYGSTGSVTEPSRNEMAEDLASPLSRIIAHAIDQWMPWVVLILISVVLAAIQDVFGEKEIHEQAVGLLMFIMVVAYLVYQFILVARYGQSLGKRVMNIRVVRLDGRQADVAQIIFVRNWLPNFLGLLTCYIFTLIDMIYLFNADGMTLHDKIAGTRVVRAINN